MFMKAKHLIIAGMALLAFAACNKENNANGPTFDGDKAYVSVKIAFSNDAATKGTDDASKPFWYGTDAEHSIDATKTIFVFYNADGSYSQIARATSLNGKGKTDTKEVNDNTEWNGDGVIVLRNLTSKSYPKYMAVVLNATQDIENGLKGKSITEATAFISNCAVAEETTDKKILKNFVMSSSTYYNNGVVFCTELKDDNFQESEAATVNHEITAYVERIAAKVTVKLNDAIVKSGQKVEIGSFAVKSVDAEGKISEDTKPLYARIDGWGLNATAPESYIFKNIENWTWEFNNPTGTTKWNDPAHFRSYWGKSVNYNNSDYIYPEYSGTIVTDKKQLNYVNYNALGVNLNSAAYCRENTNTADILTTDNFSSKVTSVLLKATLVDENNNIFPIVNYENTLWDYDGYLNRVLANNKASLPYYKADATTYKQIDKSFLKEVDAGDGVVYVVINTDKELFANNDGTGKQNLDYFNKLINGDLTGKDAKTAALYYKDGQMYYNVPIEHLNNNAKFPNLTGLKEADYGVVRNHYYIMTINSIKNLGSAVFDPEKNIVPNDDDSKKYYVGAKINILSWKVVEQGVDL